MLKDQAVLLERTKASGEWLTLSFLTPRYGKVRIAARRKRRDQSAPFLDAMQAGEILFRPADEKRPGGLTSFDARKIWGNVRGHYDRLLTGLHFCCLAGTMAMEGEPAVELYRLLCAMLDHLDAGGDPGSLRVVFELRVLELSGYGSSLENCSCCGVRTGEGDICLSASHGGLVCHECLDSRGGKSTLLPPGALNVMRRSLSLPLEKVDRLKVLPSLQKTVLPVAGEMIERIIERSLPSAALLDGLDAAGKAS